MTNEQIEAAFKEAQKQWTTKASGGPELEYQTRKERFFFFAGSEFGVKITKEIYSETIGKK